MIRGFDEARRLAVFKGLDDSELGGISTAAEPVDLDAGATLFSQGDAGDALYIIVSGRIDILKPTGKGESRKVASIEPGQAVGEMALLVDMPRSATAVAASDLRLYRIDRERFQELLAKNDPGAFKVVHNMAVELCQRLHKINEGFSALLDRKEGTERVPTADLSELRKRFFVGGWNI